MATLKTYDFRITIRKAERTASGFGVIFGGNNTVISETLFNGTLSDAETERNRLSDASNTTHCAYVSMKNPNDRKPPGYKSLGQRYREQTAEQATPAQPQQAQAAPFQLVATIAPNKYELMSDPAHGWLVVPMAELNALNLARCISPWSYISRDGKTAYLEEDSDCLTFCLAKGWLDSKAFSANTISTHHTDQRVRGLPAFPSLKDYESNRATFRESLKQEELF